MHVHYWGDAARRLVLWAALARPVWSELVADCLPVRRVHRHDQARFPLVVLEGLRYLRAVAGGVVAPLLGHVPIYVELLEEHPLVSIGERTGSPFRVRCHKRTP